MNYQALLARILQQVDEQAYLTPSSHLPEAHRVAMAEVASMLQEPAFDPSEVRAVVRRMYKDGRIDRVLMLSALHVVAASPRVQDWAEAARLIGEQEFAALEQGGPNLEANLASVDRHRGVLAFLRSHYDIALDYFTRALERQRTAENFGNVLCTLCRLGESDQASALLAQIRDTLPTELVSDLDTMIARDPDLAVLRTGDAP
jgi:DNA-binding phage protein